MPKQEFIITAEEIAARRIESARKDESFQMYLKMTFSGKDLELTLNTDAVLLTLHNAFSAGVVVGAMAKDLPPPITPSIMRGSRMIRPKNKK